MRILITGVNGFIGGSLWRYLKKHHPSIQAYGVDVRSNIQHPHIYQCDIFQIDQFSETLSQIQPDCIVHLAGGRAGDDHTLFESNICMTKCLFDSLEKLSFPRIRIIIPGSAAEYGQVEGAPVFEDRTPRPESWYGYVKFMQTQMGLMYAQKGCDVVVGRIFNIIGFGTPVALAIGKFAHDISRLNHDNEIRTLQTGNLAGRRDFLDIEDVCSALVALAFHGQSGQVYHVCSGRSLVIRDLLQTLISYAGISDVMIQEKSGDVSKTFDIVGSNLKIKRLMNWRPQIAIEQSLENTLRYYREKLNADFVSA